MTIYERAAQIWPMLALAARNRQILTYDVVGRLIGVPQHGLAQLLGPIQSYCLQHELPALTSLVVSKATGIPGTGFIAAQDIPGAQAKVFEFDWLSHSTPDSNEFIDAVERRSASAVLEDTNEKVSKARSLVESCGPFAEAVAASGVSDEEFDQFFAEARQEVWQEKQGKRE